METMPTAVASLSDDEIRTRVLTALRIVESMRQYEQERGSTDYNLDVLAILLSSIVGRIN